MLAAAGGAADLLRLHQHPVANLDHRRLLWMVTNPGHSQGSPRAPAPFKTRGRSDRAGDLGSLSEARPWMGEQTARVVPRSSRLRLTRPDRSVRPERVGIRHRWSRRMTSTSPG